MGCRANLDSYFNVGVESYRVLKNKGIPCVDVSSFYGRTPFRDRATGESIKH